MKVLVVHNVYRERGGEDRVVDAEIALLRGNGHEVLAYRRDNHELAQMAAPAAATQTLWSHRTHRELGELLARERPELVHLHNTFPLISPSAVAAAAQAGIPAVHTLHNYRLVCPQAMFLRQGRPCEDCLGRVPWPAVLHGCYRASRAQSLVAAATLQVHRWRGTWRDGVTRWIALSAFSRAKFVEAGWPAGRIDVLPNFVDPPLPTELVRSDLLYVGRLAPEKGIAWLAEALRVAPRLRLEVIGEGPEVHRLAKLPNVSCRGPQLPEAVMRAMQRARALVMPSLVHEQSPRVLIEAMACGLPVIATRHGALAEAVQDGQTGWLVPSGDTPALAAAMQAAQDDPAECARRGELARLAYERQHTPQAHLEGLMRVYHQALAYGRSR